MFGRFKPLFADLIRDKLSNPKTFSQASHLNNVVLDHSKRKIKMKIALILLVLLITSSTTFALNPKETFYHCPSIQDIQYVHGTFVATTNYNDIQMNWFTVQNFPEELVPIKKFNFTDNWNDCVGGTCAIYCVYEIESKRDTILKFSVSRQEYRFSQAVSGPWKNGVCESNKPEDCIFTVVPDQW